jgi:hypothetical protein
MALAALAVSMDPETVHWIIKARHLPSRDCPPDFGPESGHTKRAYVQVTAIESCVSRRHRGTAPQYSHFLLRPYDPGKRVRQIADGSQEAS